MDFRVEVRRLWTHGKRKTFIQLQIFMHCLTERERNLLTVKFIIWHHRVGNINGSVVNCIRKELFEELIGELLERTHDPIDVVLDDAGISGQELDMVLLVGGSTRIPLVRQDIQEYLGLEPVQAVDPDYAVAEGAAIQGGILFL